MVTLKFGSLMGLLETGLENEDDGVDLAPVGFDAEDIVEVLVFFAIFEVEIVSLDVIVVLFRDIGIDLVESSESGHLLFQVLA